jgi:hypothetical protein
MNPFSRPQVSYVRGADGSALSLSDLPAANSHRWVARHKGNVVAAVRGGLISLEDVGLRYGVTTEEFLVWCAVFDRFGIAGLRSTRSQKYKNAASATAARAAPTK